MATFDFKQVRTSLAGKVGELRALVDQNAATLSAEDRERYEKAIDQMSEAHAMLMRVNCDPPNMSFEIPPPPPPSAARKA